MFWQTAVGQSDFSGPVFNAASVRAASSSLPQAYIINGNNTCCHWIQIYPLDPECPAHYYQATNCT